MFKSICVWAFCACAAIAAQAQDLPQRKAGLWGMTMHTAGMPGGGMQSQQCIDAKTDAQMQSRAMSGDPKERCTQKSLQRIAGGVEIEAECTSPEGRTLVHSRATGDFGKNYTMDTKITFDPPRDGMGGTSVKISAQYLGECPAGMAPGQVRMAGATSRAGGAGAMPPGIDPKAMQGMTPEQLRQMAEEMKKSAGR